MKRKFGTAILIIVILLAQSIAVTAGYGVWVGVLGIVVLLLGLASLIYEAGIREERRRYGYGSVIYWRSVEKFRKHTVIVRKPDGTLEEVPRAKFSSYVARHENCRRCGTAQTQEA